MTELHYQGYGAIVEYDAEFGDLYGRLVGIPDLVTFRASEVDQVQAAFEAAVEDYLALCADLNKTPAAPSFETVSIPLEADVAMRLKALAKEDGTPIDHAAAKLIRRSLSQAR